MVLTDPLPLVPTPVASAAGSGAFPLSGTTSVSGDESAADLLADAVARRTGISLTRAAHGDVSLRIDPTVTRAEGYAVRISDRVEVIGADAAGLFYGVQTVLQLLREGDDGWGFVRAEIDDFPRFAHRGLMLDVARHFFGVDDVCRLIDAASALKFNRLHLHLTDDQGWRIHIAAWPRLTELASGTSAGGGPGGFYTQDDYREIVAHAATRHMTVIPEIDLPGHTHAIGVAYPELVDEPVIGEHLRAEAAALGQALPATGEPYLGWGVGHSRVRIRSERTYAFVRDVVRELVALTPGPYIHVGGDESLGTSPEDFAYFVARATATVVEEGRVPIVWHEVGATDAFARSTIGQYWGMTTPRDGHAEAAARFVSRDGAVILSPANAAYLDQKPSPDFPLGLTWAAVIDLRTAYEWEPTEILAVPEAAILGVEAPLWTETAQSMHDVEQLLFPRAAAIAEVAWSPASSRDWESFRARLGRIAPLWDAEGVEFSRSPEIEWAV